MSNDYKACQFAKELRVQGVFGEPSKNAGWICSADCDKCPARNPERHGYNSVFNQITQSPEVLAEKLVYLDCIDRMWHSTIFPYPENPYPTRNEAIAATVAKLKEDVEDARNHKRNA